jgi:tetratricopeptide (TPR) repeat protein
MQLSRILGFSPDYLAKLRVANVSTDRDLADCMDLDRLSHETGIPAGVLKQLSELAEWNVEVSSKRIRTLVLVAILAIGLAITFAAWLKIKSHLERVDRDVNLAIGYMKDGDQACSQKRFSAGIESYNSAIRTIPGLNRFNNLEAEAHYGLGFCYFEQQHYSLAASQIKEATDDDPQDPYYQFQLGQTYLALGQPNNAIAPFENTYRIWSDNFWPKSDEWKAKAVLWQGVAYFRSGDYENAVRNLEHLPSQRLSNYENYLGESVLGQSFYLSTLTPAYQKSTGGDPYMLANRVADAIYYLRSAIKLDDHEADDHAILGMALLKHGESPEEKQEAKIECQKALKLNPDNRDAHACLDSIPHK